jgi:hypothetical protein
VKDLAQQERHFLDRSFVDRHQCLLAIYDSSPAVPNG